MKIHDLVAVTKSGKSVLAIIVSGNTNPDHHLTLMDQQGRISQHYPDSCTHLGATIAGKQHLDHEYAAIRAELEAMATSKYGRQAVQNARMAATAVVRRGKAERRRSNLIPSPGHGRLNDYDVPLDLRGEALERFASVRDDDATPGEIGHDAREMRYLDILRERNDRYYRVYLQHVHEGMKPADIAKLEGISTGAARVLTYRAVHLYEEIASGAVAS